MAKTSKVVYQTLSAVEITLYSCTSEGAKFITRHGASFNKHVNTMYMYIYITVYSCINLVPRLQYIENQNTI